MLELAKHIVETKTAKFEPEKFEDRYEAALLDLVNSKRAGKGMAPAKSRTEGNVVDLMDALRKSLGAAAKSKPAKGKKRIADQKEMLFPISGSKVKEPAKKAQKSTKVGATKRKAG